MALKSIIERIDEIPILRALLTDYDGILMPFIDVLLLAREELIKIGTQVLNVTPGANVVINIPSGSEKLVAAWTASQNETITVTGNQAPGCTLSLLIRNGGASQRVITFGSGFLSAGTITGIVTKASTISFMSNGTVFHEVSRVVGI